MCIQRVIFRLTFNERYLSCLTRFKIWLIFRSVKVCCKRDTVMDNQEWKILYLGVATSLQHCIRVLLRQMRKEN